MGTRTKIIMVGPDIEGGGGISRVAQIYKTNGLFNNHHIKYISSITDKPVSNLFLLFKALVKFIAASMSGPSKVYFHTSSHNSFYRKSLFIIISLILSKFIILHIHPTHFFDFLYELTGVRRRYVFLILRRINIFVVLTESMRNELLKILPDKIVFSLKNPVDMKTMKNINSCQRSDHNIIYLGWYIEKKGIYELVDAIEILTQKGVKIHLDFYGTKEIEKLTEYVSKKDLTNIIQVNGWINKKEKVDALYRSAMLVLPTHTEGLPNVILEAMATCTPIISTFVGGLRDILKDGENCVITKVSDARDLSEKIQMCLEHPELRHRIAANAYEQAKINFDISIIERNFSRIIKEC